MSQSLPDDIERTTRTLQSILESVDTPYRFVKLGDGPLPEGTIEIELEAFWSQRDADTTLRGMVHDQWIQQFEGYGWALVAKSPDGQTFWIRPTTIASIVEA